MTTDIYGPNTIAVAAFIERLRTLTPEQADRLAPAWDAAAARDAAWAAAGVAARRAARVAAGDAAWDGAAAGVAARRAARDAAWVAGDAAGAAAWDAAAALVVRDLISPEHFAILVAPFVEAGLGEWLGETPA